LRRAADVAQLGLGKVLYLHGSAYEQGKQLGRGAADLIHENVRRASRLRDEIAAGRDQTDYAAVTRRNERFASRAFPKLLVYSAMLACTQVLAENHSSYDRHARGGCLLNWSKTRGSWARICTHTASSPIVT